MKAFVLMAKRTGALMVGYRVMFMDQEWAQDIQPKEMPYQVWQVGVIQHDGWIVEMPDVSPAPVFFNRKGVEQMFENLGEL